MRGSNDNGEQPYIETGCITTHEGNAYESGGAVLTDTYAIGYGSEDLRSIVNWHGDRVLFRITRWKERNQPLIFGGNLFSLWARREDGVRWYGTGAPGYICHMRSCVGREQR